MSALVSVWLVPIRLSATIVADENGLADILGQPLTHHPSEYVRRAGRSERHDEPYRLGWIFLCVCRQGMAKADKQEDRCCE